MNSFIHGVRLSVAGVILLNILGCGTSQPSHFYLLRAISPTSSSDLSEVKPSNLSVGLGPVTLPKYLDRPQIVTQSGTHEVELADFHKWAEPLSDNVSHVLTENLSALLSTDRILQYPWSSSIPVDYQIVVDVSQFDGTMGGEAVLVARWSLWGNAEKELFMQKTSRFSEVLRSGEYEELVETMSRMLASLSGEIADAIKARIPGSSLK